MSKPRLNDQSWAESVAAEIADRRVATRHIWRRIAMRRGVHIHTLDSFLVEAAKHGRAVLAERLLERGADPFFADGLAVWSAVYHEHSSTARIILTRVRSEETTADGRRHSTPPVLFDDALNCAASANNVHVMRALLRVGVMASVQALQIAVIHRHSAAICTLLSAGAEWQLLPHDIMLLMCRVVPRRCHTSLARALLLEREICGFIDRA